jgi:dTMP kinase
MPDGRGRLITIEGLDGSGKTTLAVGLEAALRERGLPVLRLREPGGVTLSERIRALVADPAIEVHPHTEALLFAAARAQLCAELLRPELDAGRWILLDRFVDSSLAYQGGGRELGLDVVARINELATLGCRPDRTILLRVDRATGRGRLASSPPTTRWPPATRRASARSTRTGERTPSSPTRSTRWPTSCKRDDGMPLDRPST